MLLTDKLEKIYQENANEKIRVQANAFLDALEKELRSSIGRGPQYDIKAHIMRMNNAWKFFVKDKPQFKSTFFEAVVKQIAPEVAKKIWPYDNKK